MNLDMRPIYEQIKRIADYMEIIARREIGGTAVTASAPLTPATQMELFDNPAVVPLDLPKETAPDPAVSTPKAGRGRPRKDSVAVAASQDLSEHMAQAIAEVVPKNTENDVRNHLMRYVQRNSKDEAIGLLRKYGALKIKDLKPIDYDPIVTDMQTDEDLHHGKAKK